ncbi:hypothetical protein CC1G_14528 [Coprinopsis cinerea okayama7|uniref:Uncharacterized protein n=1 Tax=Coprinopsis cinerea (strain Okayama-7 / 130 / ATCC MYA-4618 / FGSC 9003) TaxID=240176 RepID=D6RMX6_COPC7|nr:hypothetical protein CC1G_14528 [Coprinopsis cinerea okayama7\|eukprot:XP_002911096.1 hypothetical protein CC1G_14528 [Coprinopsis cinerea okayama7\
MALERIPSKTWTMLGRRNLAIHPQVWSNIRAGVKVRNFVMDEVVGMTGLDTCDGDLHTDKDTKPAKGPTGRRDTVTNAMSWSVVEMFGDGMVLDTARLPGTSTPNAPGLGSTTSRPNSQALTPQGRPVNEFIIIVNNTIFKLNSSAPSHSSVGVRDLNEQLDARHVGVLSSCPAADERYWKIINDYRLITSKRKRLAEAFFCYNSRYRIAILVEFEQEGPASQKSNWKLCRSVVRFEIFRS